MEILKMIEMDLQMISQEDIEVSRPQPVAEGEEILKEVEEPLVKLQALRAKYDHQADIDVAQAKHTRAAEDIAVAVSSKERAELGNKLFWYELSLGLPLKVRGGIGIRTQGDNLVVVELERKEKSR